MEPKRRGPAWADVAACLEEIGWGGAVPLREVTEGGYSPASRWIVERPDGLRGFVKAKDAPEDGARDERFEAERIVGERAELPCVPRMLAARVEGDGPHVLVSEDLSDARWGTPVTEADADALRESLDALASIDAPAGLRVLEPHDAAGVGWRHTDPATFERLGLGRAAWLERSRDALHAAAETVDVTGAGLVHDDLWLQNWCRAERGAVVVDWSGAARGNARFNHAWAEAGIRAAGGPHGRLLAPDDPEHAGWAAYMAGLAAAFLLWGVEHAGDMPKLLATQSREAMACLSWACEALGIEPPDFAPSLLAHGPWQP